MTNNSLAKSLIACLVVQMIVLSGMKKIYPHSLETANNKSPFKHVFAGLIRGSFVLTGLTQCPLWRAGNTAGSENPFFSFRRFCTLRLVFLALVRPLVRGPCPAGPGFSQLDPDSLVPRCQPIRALRLARRVITMGARHKAEKKKRRTSSPIFRNAIFPLLIIVGDAARYDDVLC